MFTFIKNLFKNNKNQVESPIESPIKLTRIVENTLGEFGVQERNQFDIHMWSEKVYYWYSTRREAERKQAEIERILTIQINRLNFKESE